MLRCLAIPKDKEGILARGLLPKHLLSTCNAGLVSIIIIIVVISVFVTLQTAVTDVSIHPNGANFLLTSFEMFTSSSFRKLFFFFL